LQGAICKNNKIELSQNVSNDASLSTIIWTKETVVNISSTIKVII
jgi:hypothetical protein